MLYVALVAIGLILTTGVPFWMISTSIAVLLIARSIWSSPREPKPLRGARMVALGLPADIDLVCTFPSRDRSISVDMPIAQG